MSSRPKTVAACRTKAAASISRSTCASANTASPPVAAISSATRLPRSTSRSAKATFAPSITNRRTVASPIPEAPPVTAATLPLSRAMVGLLCSLASQPVERGRVVARQLAAHLRRQVPHLPLDRGAGVRPDAVGMGIVRRPQEVALAEEGNQRQRHVVFLEGCVDLSLEELARLRDELAAALVGPELLRLPEPPVPVVELLDEPGQPSRAGLGHDHPQPRVPLEDAP